MADPIPVFVIDDDPSARAGLTRLLRAAGYDVHPFATADAFLEALDAEAGDARIVNGCIVLDARMPGISNEELSVALKARGYRLPIIVVTADNDYLTRHRALQMNAVGFFRKPIDGAALCDAVEWALDAEGRQV